MSWLGTSQSTCAIFPIDAETLRYLEFTGRSSEHRDLVEAYAKEQGLWLDPSAEPAFSETLELDLSTVEPSLAGPARPQDRVPLREAKRRFVVALGQAMPEQALNRHDEAVAGSFPASDPPSDTTDGGHHQPEPAQPVPVAVAVSKAVAVVDAADAIEAEDATVIAIGNASANSTAATNTDGSSSERRAEGEKS